jgi:competence protein ComEA
MSERPADRAPEPSPHRSAALGVGLVLAMALLGGWAAGRAPSSACQPGTPRCCVNPNTASAAELALLPEVGPKLAERIIAHRDAGHALRRLADLDEISGFGPHTLAAVADWVCFEAPDTAPDPHP